MVQKSGVKTLLSHHLQGLVHSRWLGMGFLNHQQYHIICVISFIYLIYIMLDHIISTFSFILKHTQHPNGHIMFGICSYIPSTSGVNFLRFKPYNPPTKERASNLHNGTLLKNRGKFHWTHQKKFPQVLGCHVFFGQNLYKLQGHFLTHQNVHCGVVGVEPCNPRIRRDWKGTDCRHTCHRSRAELRKMLVVPLGRSVNTSVQLMVNCWFGFPVVWDSRGAPKNPNLFRQGILGIQTTGTQTSN